MNFRALIAAVRAIAFWLAIAIGAIALCGLYAWLDPEAPTTPIARQS
ncbi:hypothetical protein ACU4GI_10820 [Cupriavidus basilensis]